MARTKPVTDAEIQSTLDALDAVTDTLRDINQRVQKAGWGDITADCDRVLTLKNAIQESALLIGTLTVLKRHQEDRKDLCDRLGVSEEDARAAIAKAEDQARLLGLLPNKPG